jgi:hypothetical protein
MRANREEGQGVGREEWLRLDAEVKELRESVETRLAKSNQKTSLVLSILLKIEERQSKEKGVNT